jgi:hypothetical protein
MDILINYRILPDGTPQTSVLVGGQVQNIYSPFADIYDLPVDDWFNDRAIFAAALETVVRGRPYHLTFEGIREAFQTFQHFFPDADFVEHFVELEEEKQKGSLPFSYQYLMNKGADILNNTYLRGTSIVNLWEQKEKLSGITENLNLLEGTIRFVQNELPHLERQIHHLRHKESNSTTDEELRSLQIKRIHYKDSVSKLKEIFADMNRIRRQGNGLSE